MNEEIIHVKTQSGFEADINADALDDMELLEDLSRMDAGEQWLAARVILRLLGGEQKKKLYDVCRDPHTRRVPIGKVSALLQELFAAPELKK